MAFVTYVYFGAYMPPDGLFRRYLYNIVARSLQFSKGKNDILPSGRCSLLSSTVYPFRVIDVFSFFLFLSNTTMTRETRGRRSGSNRNVSCSNSNNTNDIRVKRIFGTLPHRRVVTRDVRPRHISSRSVNYNGHTTIMTTIIISCNP